MVARRFFDFSLRRSFSNSLSSLRIILSSGSALRASSSRSGFRALNTCFGSLSETVRTRRSSPRTEPKAITPVAIANTTLGAMADTMAIMSPLNSMSSMAEMNAAAVADGSSMSTIHLQTFLRADLIPIRYASLYQRACFGDSASNTYCVSYIVSHVQGGSRSRRCGVGHPYLCNQVFPSSVAYASLPATTACIHATAPHRGVRNARAHDCRCHRRARRAGKRFRVCRVTGFYVRQRAL